MSPEKAQELINEIQRLRQEVQQIKRAENVEFAESVKRNVLSGTDIEFKGTKGAGEYRYTNSAGIFSTNNAFNGVARLNIDGTDRFFPYYNN